MQTGFGLSAVRRIGAAAALCAALAGCGHKPPAPSAPASQTGAPQTAANAPGAQPFQPYVIINHLPPAPKTVAHLHRKLRFVRQTGHDYLVDSAGHAYLCARDSRGRLCPAYQDPGTGAVYPLRYDPDRDDYYRLGCDEDGRFYRCYVGQSADEYYEDDRYDAARAGCYPPDNGDDEAEIEAPGYGGGGAWISAVPVIVGAYFLLSNGHGHNGDWHDRSYWRSARPYDAYSSKAFAVNHPDPPLPRSQAVVSRQENGRTVVRQQAAPGAAQPGRPGAVAAAGHPGGAGTPTATPTPGAAPAAVHAHVAGGPVGAAAAATAAGAAAHRAVPGGAVPRHEAMAPAAAHTAVAGGATAAEHRAAVGGAAPHPEVRAPAHAAAPVAAAPRAHPTRETAPRPTAPRKAPTAAAPKPRRVPTAIAPAPHRAPVAPARMPTDHAGPRLHRRAPMAPAPARPQEQRPAPHQRPAPTPQRPAPQHRLAPPPQRPAPQQRFAPPPQRPAPQQRRAAPPPQRPAPQRRAAPPPQKPEPPPEKPEDRR